jgi:hypothetical protein
MRIFLRAMGKVPTGFKFLGKLRPEQGWKFDFISINENFLTQLWVSLPENLHKKSQHHREAMLA